MSFKASTSGGSNKLANKSTLRYFLLLFYSFYFKSSFPLAELSKTLISSSFKATKSSLTLNSYLYAEPNCVERLSQQETRSKKEYQVQAGRTLDDFDRRFLGVEKKP
jgi:hypothetical protein